LQAFDRLPSAVLAARHRDDAVVAARTRLRLGDDILQRGGAHRPIDHLLAAMVAASVADAVGADGESEPCIGQGAGAAPLQQAESSRKMRALTKLNRNWLWLLGSSGRSSRRSIASRRTISKIRASDKSSCRTMFERASR